MQIADLAFVAAAPTEVAPFVADARLRRRYLPTLDLRVTEDRGPLGQRWSCTGAVTGTAEVWLEAHLDGTLIHFFVHGRPGDWSDDTPAESGEGARAAHAISENLRHQGKMWWWDIAHAVDAGRPAGIAPDEWKARTRPTDVEE